MPSAVLNYQQQNCVDTADSLAVSLKINF